MRVYAKNVIHILIKTRCTYVIWRDARNFGALLIYNNDYLGQLNYFRALHEIRVFLLQSVRCASNKNCKRMPQFFSCKTVHKLVHFIQWIKTCRSPISYLSGDYLINHRYSNICFSDCNKLYINTLVFS